MNAYHIIFKLIFYDIILSSPVRNIRFAILLGGII